jgi:acid phosphatase family membrane protein YuiD
MTGPAAWPAWLVVMLGGLVFQILKTVVYSLNARRLLPEALFQGRGVPSLTGVVCGCLLAATILRSGWQASETSFALVFGVILVHDTVKLSGLADRQRATVLRLQATLDEARGGRRQVAVLLDPRAHHPAHVAVGVVLGALFALALAAGPR